MGKLFRSMALCVCALSLLQLSWRAIPASRRSFRISRDEAPASEVEAAFARGERVYLDSIDLYDLELIPRMSESLASRILEDREEILRYARNLPSSFEASSLHVVRGIGTKKSESIANYLEILREDPQGQSGRDSRD